ncbi:hypothetical protein EON63_05620 [archaeon]|nr:MAG: hypothetical protein EON63_05620 [archaeon]
MREIVMTKEEEKRMHYKNSEFEKTRALPTRREFDKSMSKWHKGMGMGMDMCMETSLGTGMVWVWVYM